jgi:hypothetical protein
MRPPLLGFDQYAAGLLLITNQVAALRMDRGNGKAEMVKGPIFPLEIIEQRLSKFAAVKRTDAIARAQRNYRERVNSA